MRHSRKSRANAFKGFKEHLVLALDSKVTREVMVCPATPGHSRTLSIREDEQFQLMTRHEPSLNSIMILIMQYSLVRRLILSLRQ